MKTILTAAGARVEPKLAECIQETVDFATWNEGAAQGIAFVELARIVRDDPTTRCVIRAVLEDVGPIVVGATGADAWEAVQRSGEQLESAFIARLNRAPSGVAAFAAARAH